MAALRDLTTDELAGLVEELLQLAKLPSQMRPLKHLTEEQLADRWGISPQALAILRKAGKAPKCLEFAKSATKCTRRYRLVDVVEWEQENLVVPGPA